MNIPDVDDTQLVFSEFHPLKDLVDLKFHGQFIKNWKGDYEKIWENSRSSCYPSNGGSGILVTKVPMKNESELPEDLRSILSKKGVVYILGSSRYPILYVGITEGDIQNSFFGKGRLIHHLRKLMASTGGGTRHTRGWLNHALERYEDNCNNFRIDVGLDIELVSDIRIAFAASDFPKKYEGTVLDVISEYFELKKQNFDILNSASLQRHPIKVLKSNNIDDLFQSNLEPSTSKFRENSFVSNTAPVIERENIISNDETKSIDDYQKFVSEMSQVDADRFVALLQWARTQSEFSSIQEKTVNGYTNQPAGYNGVPMVTFAEIGESGKAKARSWLCRIPLKCSEKNPMNIILPTRCMKGTLNQSKVFFGHDPNFSPLDLDDFLESPNDFISFF